MLVMLTALLLVSCEVEFSPNAEYKETPVIYCVLDQDDDTVWARVERCFLEEGNIYSFGSDASLLNYPQGSIKVELIAFRNGSENHRIALRDTLRAHLSGPFADEPQPIYFATQPLDSTCMYKLEVRRASDDSLMASTDSIALILQLNSQLISRPANNTRFAFSDNASGTAVCKIVWNPLANARRYQPIVRFFYGEDGDTHYVDLKCAHVTSGANITAYPLESFLNSLKNALQDDPNPKEYLKYVEIYLTACDENLNVYINNVASGVSLNQTADTYTNVHGGLGIFAARRTHLFKYLDADPSMNPLSSSNPGLYSYLHALGIGF
jgi:hypothetical protein